MRTPWAFLADGWRCFRQFRKWRQAARICHAIRPLEDLGYYAQVHELMDIQKRLYDEIHNRRP